MDQDNKHILIDDLVRQRLGGHEEPERSGAWANMRALLDEQERKNPRGAYFWNRRNLSALLLLLLVGGVTMGGLLNQRADHDHNASSSAGVAAATNPADGVRRNATSSHVTIADRSLSLSETGMPAEATPAASGTTDHPNHLRQEQTPTQPYARASTPGTSNSHNRNANPATQPASPNALAANAGNGQPARQPEARVRGNNHQPRQHAASTRNQQAATAANVPKPDDNALTASVTTPAQDRNAVASVAGDITPAVANGVKPSDKTRRNFRNAPKNNAGPKANGTKPADKPVETGNLALNTAAGNTTPKQANSQKQVVTLPSVTVKQKPTGRNLRARRSAPDFDTIGKGTIDIVRDVPALAKPDDATAAADAAATIMAPAATPNTTPATPAHTVVKRVVLPEPWEPVLTPAAVNLAARTKASGTALRLHGGSVTGSHAKSSFDAKMEMREFFRTLNFRLSQIKVHPGMTAGLNSAPFGDISLNGFHLGASATFVINEAWSILTELRYNRKMAGNQVLTDDYVQCSPYSSNVDTNAVGVHMTTYEWDEKSVNRFFNIAGLHYLDLPVHVRYHYRKFLFEGGLNLLYAFATNVEERTYEGPVVTRNYSVPSQYAKGVIPGYDVMKPTMQTTDFGSRFGMGYSLGVGYQISSAVQADLRVSRQFWDNAKTRGAMKVSDILFNQPVLQLSIGYRFGERERE